MSRGGDSHDAEIRAIVLDALIAGRAVDDIADVLRPLHVEGSTYPASVLLDLAADAYLACAEPEDTGWWSTDELWRHALDAAVVFVRAAAERQSMPVEHVCASPATT